MFIKDGIYRSIKPQVALPIAEGTVLTINGLAATADTAYGIVPENITALSPTKQIYVAVSGTIDLKDPANKGVSFDEDMIKALGADFNFVRAAEIAEPAPELPTVSAADNGKVLKVVDGAWAAGEGGGGSNTLVVTADEETGALDKTWNEIYAALGAGKYVVSPYAYEDGTEAGQYICVSAISLGASTYNVYFICHGGGTSVMAVTATASSADGYPVFSN